MKLVLTINEGSLAGQRFELETGFLSIGRGPTCSVRFDPMTERIASKQHAFIEATPDGYFITDNQSTNGTFVNGERIEKARLKTGDRIQFGKNGTVGTVMVSDAAGVPATQDNFREVQLEQFQSIASHQPKSISLSMSSIGLGVLPPDPAKDLTTSGSGKGLKYIAASITILAIVFLSLVVVVLISSALSPVTRDGGMTLSLEGVVFAFIASFVAFIPAMFYVLPLIWLDRYDPEPSWLLALAFAWGALVAVIFSFIINTTIGSVAYSVTGSPDISGFISGVISAPVFEEASKGVGLLILLIFFRKYFDDILDGIVFAGVIALGFATVENVLYYGRAVSTMQVGSLVVLFIMRGVLSPFAHVTFTAMTGIGCGIARESHNTFVKIAMPIVGYCAAVVLHALWNGMAIIGGFGSFLVGYLILEIPFFLIFVGFSFYIMYRQNKILREMLAIDIARGMIPKEHGDIATSAFKSSGWVIGGIFAGKFRARTRYLRALGKLGLSYWHIQRATAAQGQTGSFQQNPLLREEVLKWRDQVN